MRAEITFNDLRAAAQSRGTEAGQEMLAARTGTVGGKSADESLKLRKQSVLSLGSRDRALKSSAESSKEGRPRVGQPHQRARRLALLRELEMNWYLRVCELSHEYTIAYTTGMPHRYVPALPGSTLPSGTLLAGMIAIIVIIITATRIIIVIVIIIERSLSLQV